MVDLEAPKSSQVQPRSFQNEPERAPTHFQIHLWIEHVDFSKIELPPKRNQGMRVGGSDWEFKVDPKRLRKKIKHDIEIKQNK